MIYSGKSIPINLLLEENKKHQNEQARKILTPIVDTYVTASRMGIALRGHQDDSKYHPEPGGFSLNSTGNAVEMLNFRVRGGDKDLKNHMENAPRNATYMSKTIQNELIKCSGDVILDKIIPDVKKAIYYSIIADEAHDKSNKELMSVCLRYFDSEFKIKESFVGYVHLINGLSGASIADAIIDFISSLGLDIQNCRGQGYDGAGAMAGKISGCSTRILFINPKAPYTHCFCH